MTWARISNMTIATWNVNSVRARLERLLAFLQRAKPDVLCLQELKAQEHEVPWAEVAALGYQAAVFGQKTYNGVAILSRLPIAEIKKGMPGHEAEARVVSATIAGVRVVSVYVPNGFEVGSDKYAYKQAFLADLHAFLKGLCPLESPVAVCGDFNIIPDDKDCWDPTVWEGTVLYNKDMRSAFQGLLGLGLVDVLRRHNQAPGVYTFWDYQQLAFPKNHGLRIDFVLASPPLAERCTGCKVLRDERKGQRPSDHVPVVAEFSWP